MSVQKLPSDKVEVTWEDFARWILALPDDIKTKQIWFVDIGMVYKGKPMNFEYSPTGEFIGIDENFDDEEKG